MTDRAGRGRTAALTLAGLVGAAAAVAALTVALIVRGPGAGVETSAPPPGAVPPRASAPRDSSDLHPLLREAARWAGRGAWDSAVVALTAYVESADRPDAFVDAYGLAALGAWMGVLERHRVDPLRRSLPGDAGLSARSAAQVAWLDGLLAFTARDGRGVDEARLRIRESSAALATDLERSLRAFQLALDGEELRAARLLRRLEEDRESRPGAGSATDLAGSLPTPVNRLAAAHWFVRNGRSVDGLPLLDAQASARSASRGGEAADLALAAFVHLERARAEAALGLDQAARRDFREFVRRYDLPRGPARTWVRDARAAIADP